MKLFSYKRRPVHLGPYPLERLARSEGPPDLTVVPPMTPVSFDDSERPHSLTNAMAEFAAMLDAIRDGLVKKERAVIPSDPQARAEQLKAFGYYCDASQIGTCNLSSDVRLTEPVTNPGIQCLAEDLRTRQTETLASGIDVIMAELKESMESPPTRIDHHSYAIVFLYEYPRDPQPGEAGGDWIHGTQAQRASLRAAETAVVVASFIRLLGFDARAHTGSCSDVDLHKLAVVAGLAEVDAADGTLSNPYVGAAFGLAAVTTCLEIAPDRPLAPRGLRARWRSHGPAWWLGLGFAKNAFSRRPYARRRFVDGLYPFERIKRRDRPTTFIDEDRVPRVPKRTDMFSRAQFGDLGTHVQDNARNGHYARKSPYSFAARGALGALVLLQDGEVAAEVPPQAEDPARNARNLKAACHFLGADAVGLSACPSWTYYSHNAVGEPIEPYHENAVSMIIDQGHETMEGASGDDWISCSQSMRAYLRFSLLGGVIANQIRRLGYSARAHTVLDGEVLQPPLLLLSGLGEVSRIGEVILNPYLGPRLKSGVVTTDMPFTFDKPIDFGLQNFCENCNKCARECPSGAITAGPKRMFNGYEIWKSDSQRCTIYRVAQAAGAMCGRCMKTCPWNLEGLFAEAPFRWLAMKVPRLARALARFDDWAGNGRLNPVKKWWWDLEMVNEGPYAPAGETNARDLQTDLDLKHEDQTLAVYPAHLVPPPHFFPFPMRREEGIRAYQAMLSPAEHRARLAAGDTEGLVPQPRPTDGEQPVMRVAVSKVEPMTDAITKYELSSLDDAPLPAFEAGAHLDIAVSPEFFRQYSLSGAPHDRSKYQIAVLREEDGRGGSKLLHRIFNERRKVFVSRPINNFALREDAAFSLLMAGGIGVTPLLAMAHRLHALNAGFELHYSSRSREKAAFVDDLTTVAWADRVQFHFSQQDRRADLDAILSRYAPGWHVYVCGPDRYMTAVAEAAAARGIPEAAVHREYFALPEAEDWVNRDFVLRLERSGVEFTVPADKTATDVLAENGMPVMTKCADGLCGVCATPCLDGEVEHRDYVLSAEDRRNKIILCCSRAKEAGGVIVVDL